MSNGSNGDSKYDELSRRLAAFEERYIKETPKKRRSDWNDLKSGIEDIIESSKAPAVIGKAKRPVILVATPEIVSLPPEMGNLAEFVSTGDGGGLADISAALVAEFYRLGVNVHVTVPEFKDIFAKTHHIRRDEYEKLKKNTGADDTIYPISAGIFEGAKRVYGDDHTGLENVDVLIADAFMEGVIYRVFPLLEKQSDDILIHCNDWMTGLLPAAAKSRGIKSLMTFHNIFTQHQTPRTLQKQGIDVEPFWHNLSYRHHPDKFGGHFWGNAENNEVDFMASGLFAADAINTVSPMFLKEIVSDYFAEHYIIPDSLRNMVKTRDHQNSARGILNAPSESADPRIDPLIEQHFWYEDTGKEDCMDLIDGKRKNKWEFQKRMNLETDPDIPLIFWPSRVARPQKGYEILLRILPELMWKYGRLQIATVANGDLELIHQMERYMGEFPGRISYHGFDRKLSQLGKAGADGLLMPSLYEPCGIPQLEGPRYGTLPIVRLTGGLADTISHMAENGMTGNGFVFEHYLDSGLLNFGIKEFMTFEKKPADFRYNVLRRVIKESFEKFNITNTAKQYIELYEEIFRRHGRTVKLT